MTLPRIVAGIVKTGVRKGETPRDKLVKRVIDRDVKKGKTQLNKDKRVILRKRKPRLTKKQRQEAADVRRRKQDYYDNYGDIYQSPDEIKKEEAARFKSETAHWAKVDKADAIKDDLARKKAEAIEKALDKKKKGGMYNVGIGAAVILGAGTLTAQTAYADDLQVAKAPTNMDYISFYKPQPYTKKSGVRGPKKTHKTLNITQPFSLFK